MMPGRIITKLHPGFLLTGLLAFFLYDYIRSQVLLALVFLKRTLIGDYAARAKKISPRRTKKLINKLDRVERHLLSYKEHNNLASLERGVSALKSIGHLVANAGNLELAEHCLDRVAKFESAYSYDGLTIAHDLGIWQFMRGYLGRAKKSFEKKGRARQYLQTISRISTPDYLALDQSWFAAFGHVAMIDILLKKRQLGWCGDVEKFVVIEDVSKVAGKVILGNFLEHGVELADHGSLASYYNAHRKKTDPSWNMLLPGERAGLLTGFWDYDFPDGDICFFAHGAAKIQGEWERKQLPPLLSLSKSQQEGIGTITRRLGIPEGAWYVCLHVRERGFYEKWSKLYPSARDANIEDYYPAINAIVERGGWVIRMGDSSMKPLRPMPGMVDYVHTGLKSEQADTLLAAGCRFMLGTNSGFTIIPASYGVPCALTNWAPVLLPNWYGCDLMIPKLMRSKSSGQLLDFDTMFEEPLGVIQNMLDFPEDIELVSNTPDEIVDVTVEMIDRLDGRSYTDADNLLQESYYELAVKKGSYRGSRIGREFLDKHRRLLPNGQQS